MLTTPGANTARSVRRDIMEMPLMARKTPVSPAPVLYLTTSKIKYMPVEQKCRFVRNFTLLWGITTKRIHHV